MINIRPFFFCLLTFSVCYPFSMAVILDHFTEALSRLRETKEKSRWLRKSIAFEKLCSCSPIYTLVSLPESRPTSTLLSHVDFLSSLLSHPLPFDSLESLVSFQTVSSNPTFTSTSRGQRGVSRQRGKNVLYFGWSTNFTVSTISG